MNKKRLMTSVACLAVATIGLLTACGEAPQDPYVNATKSNFEELLSNKEKYVRLAEDIELDNRLVLDQYVGEIDLNNKTLSIKNDASQNPNGILKATKSDLVLKNGKLNSTSDQLTLVAAENSKVSLNNVKLTNEKGAGIGAFTGATVKLNGTSIDVADQALATNNAEGGKGQSFVVENGSEVKSKETTVYLSANTNLTVKNSKIIGKTPIHVLLGFVDISNSTLKTEGAETKSLDVQNLKVTNGPQDLSDGSAILVRANWYTDRVEHTQGEDDLGLTLSNVTFDNGDAVDVSVYNLKEVTGSARKEADADQYSKVKTYLKTLDGVTYKFYKVTNDAATEDNA